VSQIIINDSLTDWLTTVYYANKAAHKTSHTQNTQKSNIHTP